MHSPLSSWCFIHYKESIFFFALLTSLFTRRKYTYKGDRISKGFADSLKSEEDKQLFSKMLNECQKYGITINAKKHLFNRNLDYGSSISTVWVVYSPVFCRNICKKVYFEIIVDQSHYLVSKKY
jgi:hypothetical protein